MDIQKLRNGFGTAAGRTAQISAYNRICRDAAEEIERLRDALRRVKDRVTGEALPKWENTPNTGNSRRWIADECDIALGNVPLTPNVQIEGLAATGFGRSPES